MSRINSCVCAFLMLSALASSPANAFNCLKDHKPFQLVGDSIEYGMTIAPGADCIQGLRWSFMQIYAVWVLKEPTSGELDMVGTGFRYHAKPEFSGTDKFTLVVVGKNRHEEGYSTVDIIVSRPNAPTTLSAASQAGSQSAPKIADAVPAH